jgi:trk system potassium uptake protein TrkH
MNYAMIFRILGWMLVFEAGFMAPSAIVAAIYREASVIWLFVSMAIVTAAGLFLRAVSRPRRHRIYAREGAVICALIWFLYSIFGALPFKLSGYIPDMFDAVFETASGFTTTGASILSDVEVLPHWLLFWRSFTHWVGGMGILVFVMAIIPLASGGSAMYLMKAESPGPSVKKMVPKASQTAGLLYKMYIFLTVLQLLILVLGRMPLFDALCITFGTAGTGGFSVLNSGCATYTIFQQVVITVFMILFGTNFSVFYLIMMGRIREVPKVSEAMAYYGIIGAAVALITVNIRESYPSIGLAIKDAAFQVGSIITTTGFATTDFNIWPAFSKWILILLMFVGACAGSTGGGIKVSRVQVVFKAIMKELDSVIHPNDVRKIRYDGKVLDHAVLRGINVFITAYFVVFGLSVLLVSVDNFGLETNFSAVAATLNNIGPGLGGVGPASNFSGYGAFSTCVLIFDMIAGRLEILPVLILLSPHTWVEGPVLRGKRVRRSREAENDLMMSGSLEMELG